MTDDQLVTELAWYARLDASGSPCNRGTEMFLMTRGCTAASAVVRCKRAGE